MPDQMPIQDLAEPLLRGEPTITDEQREALWNVFHESKSADELAQQLQPLALPDDFKKQLYDAKQKAIPPVTESLNKTTQALNHLAGLDPAVLQAAETHPNVLKALLAAVTTPAMGATEPAGGSKSVSKGKESSKASMSPTRAPDVPAVPSGHVLVQDSDGGLHHIPIENLDTIAKGIDPNLTVLHVEP